MAFQKTVKNGKVLKTVVIRMIHCNKMDAGSRGSLEAGIVEVNKLLQEEAITKNHALWTAKAVGFDRKAGMESKLKIRRVQEEIKAREVLASVTLFLIAFFQKKEDFELAWIERSSIHPIGCSGSG